MEDEIPAVIVRSLHCVGNSPYLLHFLVNDESPEGIRRPLMRLSCWLLNARIGQQDGGEINAVVGREIWRCTEITVSSSLLYRPRLDVRL